jgi:hypothetical protein
MTPAYRIVDRSILLPYDAIDACHKPLTGRGHEHARFEPTFITSGDSRPP